MRWTRTFIPTLREAPSDAESPGHKLMVRAGLVRHLAARGAGYLPLGTRALRKIEAIIREELDRAGAVELLLPLPPPPEDRKGDGGAPAPEELFTPVVRTDLRSYRQLPLILYQVQGIRGDACSFDADEKGMGRSTKAITDACVRIFSRAGLRFMSVEAEPGHEFVAATPFGKDSVVTCAQCRYAASREKAECPPHASDVGGETRELLPLQETATPGATTIEQVSQFLHVPPKSLLKTMIYRADSGFVAALVRGDHEVNESKLRRAAGTESLRMATPEEILRETGGPPGFSGPVGLKMRILADHAVTILWNLVAGANKRDAHYTNVNLNRDFRPAATADLRRAVAGDPCPRCRSPLSFTQGIEVGRVFKLGTRPSAKMNCAYADDQGALQPLAMGCSGIALDRVLAAAVENHHDEAGVIWPREIAPYQVEIVSLEAGKMQIMEAAHSLYDSLTKAGVEALWDDRDAAPGVKFADADLIGLPVRVTVGKRVIDGGTVDVRARNKKEPKSVPIEQAMDAVNHELSEYRV